jgi:hypothetical protein
MTPIYFEFINTEVDKGETKNAYVIFVKIPIGKEPLGKPRWSREDNIEIGLRKIRCEEGRWMELAQDRVQWQALVLAVLNLRVLLPELVN